MEDFYDLELFLSSGFHNRSHLRTDVIRLFSLLKSFYPEYQPKELQKERIYGLLYPGNVVKGKLEKTAAELNKLIREYLIWKEFQTQENEFQKALIWSSVLNKFSLNERYDLFLNRMEKDFLSPEAPLSPDFFYHKFLLEYQRHNTLGKSNDAKGDTNLTATIDSLSTFFEIYRLELLNRFLSQQMVTTLEVSPSVRHNLDTIFHLIPEDANIILKISSLIFRLLNKKSPTLEEFSTLRLLLRENESRIAPVYLAEYHTYLRNFCTFLIYHADQQHLIPELHQLHRYSIERGHLLVDNRLQPNSYLNITRNAIWADNLGWAISFVEDFKDKIAGETEKREFYLINKAQCLYAQGEFEAALDILPPTSDNATYYRFARRLELMCNYELGAGNIISKIEAFKMLIRRASEKFLTPDLRDQNNAFANFLYQIVVTTPGDVKRASKIAERIKAKTNVAETRWLLSKAEAMSEGGKVGKKSRGSN